MEPHRRRLASLTIILIMALSIVPGGLGGTIVSLAQPNIVIQLTYVNATGQHTNTVADGWDMLNFTLNITNNGVDPAYDVQVNNTVNSLDPAIWAVNLTNIVAYNTTSNTVLTNGTDILITPFPNNNAPLWINIKLLKPIPPGGSILVNYTINVSERVLTGSTYYNEANLTWYSDTAGGPNLVTTAMWSNVTVSVPPPLVTSKIVYSSGVDMTGLVLSGVPEPEVVTIGELLVFEVNITVPEGTTWNMTIRDWLPTTGGVLLAEYTGISNVTVNASQVSSTLVSLTPGTWTTISGTRTGLNSLIFDLGNVTNLNNTPEAEQISVRFEVIVLDVPENVAGTLLVNEAAVSYINASGQMNCPQCAPPLRVTASAVVHEPNVTITKTFNETTINNTSPAATVEIHVANNPSLYSSPAYDVVIEDVVPGNLTVLTASVASSGAVNVNLIITGNNVTVTADRLDPGGYINITIDVTAFSGTYVNATFNNTATANYSSLPGNVDGERLYTNSSWALITYTAGFDAWKLVDDLVPDMWAPSTMITAPPGAIVMYNITVEVPLGLIPVLNLTDILDPLTTLIPLTVALSSSPTVTWSSGTIATGSNFLSLVLYNVSTSSTTGYLYLTYVAQISNTTTSGDVVVNSMNVTSVDGILDSFTILGSTLIQVGEPDLTASSKMFNVDIFYHTYPYAVIYINVSNNGTLPAYDIIMEDLVPITLLVLNATIDSQAGAAGVTLTQTGNNITLTIDTLDPGGYVVIEAWVRAYALTPWNSTTVNEATLQWTSLPGDVVGEKSYNTTLVDDVFYDPIVDGVKVMGPESVTVGAIVEAVINITIPTGNTSSLILVDQWDNGMSLVGGPIITYPPDIIVTGPITTSTAGNTLTINFGGVANNATVPLNITVTLYLRIDYVPSYPNGTLDLTYVNNATIQWIDDGYLVERSLGVSAMVYIPPLVGGEALTVMDHKAQILALALGLAAAAYTLYRGRR